MSRSFETKAREYFRGVPVTNADLAECLADPNVRALVEGDGMNARERRRLRREAGKV
jgi:hypothetical protein